MESNIYLEQKLSEKKTRVVLNVNHSVEGKKVVETLGGYIMEVERDHIVFMYIYVTVDENGEVSSIGPVERKLKRDSYSFD